MSGKLRNLFFVAVALVASSGLATVAQAGCGNGGYRSSGYGYSYGYSSGYGGNYGGYNRSYGGHHGGYQGNYGGYGSHYYRYGR